MTAVRSVEAGGPGRPARSLWRDRDFLKLWAGQSVSSLGAQVTTVALPLTAVLFLQATPGQMGLLTAAGLVPFLVLSLPAGVLIDRVRRRPVLIAVDLARVVLLAAIPGLYFLDRLSFGVLLGLSLAIGTCSMLFELAYPSYLPSLVRRESLMEGNAKLMASVTTADVAGPGLAGLLVGALSAPVALLVDAASFLASALGLAAIRRREPPPVRGTSSARAELAEGLRTTFGNSMLRAGACAAATYNLCWTAIEAILILYAVGRLQMSPAVFGLAFTIGAAGALLGALTTVPIARRVGPGPTIVGSAVLSCTALLLLPVMTGPVTGAVILAVALFLRGLGLSGWNVQIEGVQQALVTSRLLGRMNASYLLVSLGAGALGALVGGYLGGTIGLRPTLLVAALGLTLAPLWLILSPLRRLKVLPQHPV